MGRSRVVILGGLEILGELGVLLVEEERVVLRKPHRLQVSFVIDRFLSMVECSFCLQMRQIFRFRCMINNYKNTTYIH